MKENLAIKTKYKDKQRNSLKVELVKSLIKKPQEGEILVEMKYAPIHGSFWLSSHPKMLHPRKNEFLKNGAFVFGNGGVGKVIKKGKNSGKVNVGDYVAIFGHIPCKHKDCRACYKEHRYVECEYGESKILGHGGGAPNGTFAKYVPLPEHSYEICFRKNERPSQQKLMVMMFAFLLADVRNALTRDIKKFTKERVLLFGTGLSGTIAGHLILQISKGAKILAIEKEAQKLKNFKKINPNRIQTCLINGKNDLNKVSKKINIFFKNKKPDLIFDASSGNNVSIWTNKEIVGSGALIIPFGFGQKKAEIKPNFFQISGVTLRTSRGVGNLENRKDTINMIRGKTSKFIQECLLEGSLELRGLEAALKFINDQFKRSGNNVPSPKAYIKF